MFTTEKVGDTMTLPTRSRPRSGSACRLTLVARSRADIVKGSRPDYLYTHLRSYYRDPASATGWNNRAFPNVGMPNVLWQLQGQRAAKFVEEKDPHDPSRRCTRSPVTSSSRRER